MIVYRHSWCQCPRWHGGNACGTDMTAFYRRICPQWCWLYLLFARWDRFPILAEVVDCVFDGGGFVSLDILLYPFFLALWFLCWSSWCPPGLTPVGWLSNLFTNWAMWKQNFPSLFWWCQRLKSRINSQIHFQETTKNFKTEVPTDKNIEQNLKEIT